MPSSGINHMTPEKTSRRKKNPNPAFRAKCIDCGNEIWVSLDSSTSSTFESKWFQFDSGLYKFSYFDCPYCRRRHLVQVDDEFSSSKADRLVQALNSKKDVSVIKKLLRDLDRARKKALGKIDGESYFDPDSGLSHIVELVSEEECNVVRTN